MNSSPTAKDLKIAKAKVHLQGKTLKQWAIDHGFPPAEVYKVMSGERKALYGVGYQIAVALGVKKQVTEES